MSKIITIHLASSSESLSLSPSLSEPSASSAGSISSFLCSTSNPAAFKPSPISSALEGAVTVIAIEEEDWNKGRKCFSKAAKTSSLVTA